MRKPLTPFAAADIMRFGQSSLSRRSTKLGFQYPIKLSIALGQSRGANYKHKKMRLEGRNKHSMQKLYMKLLPMEISEILKAASPSI
jgi:hypothetical protein